MGRIARWAARAAFLVLLATVLDRSSAGSRPETPVRPPRAGDLLVAVRGMQDPNFTRTVVLLLRNDEHGASGIVVNRPLDVAPDVLLPEIDGLADHGQPAFQGGPVALDRFAVLVRADRAPDGTERILEGVYLGASREVLERLAASRKTRQSFRIFVGHAGWAPGQLDGELERGSWHLVAGDRASVFAEDPSTVWPRLVPPDLGEWAEVQGSPLPGTSLVTDLRVAALGAYQRSPPPPPPPPPPRSPPRSPR